jgi:chitodextrinase
MRQKSFLLVTLAAALLASACDKGSPVAPRGANLQVTASPLEIGVLGTSAITVTAHRGNGVPVNPGTEIRLSTTLGSIPEVVTTDERGIARAVLQGGDRPGTARITASSGSVEAATVEVKVGIGVGRVLLDATPRAVSVSGGQVQLTATVLDDRDAVLADTNVTFLSPLGQLSSAVVRSDAQGRATTTLTLSGAELRAHNESTFQASAEAGPASSRVIGRVTLRIIRPPTADFSHTRAGLQVIFTDTSTGDVEHWRWDFGDGARSTQQHPTHTYALPGSYAVSLTVTNAEGSDEVRRFVTVP